MIKNPKKLGEILISRGLITEENLKTALDEQKKTNEFLGKILLRTNQIKEKELLGALSEQFGIPVVSLKYQYIDWQFVKQFAVALIFDYKCFPISSDERSVTMAIANPLDAWALSKAEEELRGLNLKLVLASELDINEAIEGYRKYLRANITNIFNPRLG